MPALSFYPRSRTRSNLAHANLYPFCHSSCIPVSVRKLHTLVCGEPYCQKLIVLQLKTVEI
uniref:Uncharacterized protein n=1 Tax=Arundo donax TaxID=35708 RepID=A0A0A9C8E9_ARUDO